ncbi:hypothetical protein IMX17_07265 [Serratia sp. X3]|uniref:hypothetical protein n=1 Tax=Serratia sp. X3 TaxID=2780495 RepID=UPI00187598B7|nr:hypothetical protein [Serratia sp. X3]MBE4973193.1 hypothetical protein [Serratia sp. X3]
MLITATGNGRKLVESGTFHFVCGEGEQGLKLNYGGLDIIIVTNVLTDEKAPKTILSVEVNSNNITFTHNFIKSPLGTPAGLIIPHEIGTKKDGGRIYITWLTFVQKTSTDQTVLITTYSLYEDA